MSIFFKKLPKKTLKNKNLKPVLKYILVLLITSRVILTLAGLQSRRWFEPLFKRHYEWHYSDIQALDLWGVWDSGWYLDIAQNGYSVNLKSNLPKRVSPGQANYAFFPLYPLMMRFLGKMIGNFFLAGIILSNVFLIIASLYFYQLVLLDANQKIALRSVRYLFFYPLAFIFSGVFTESLFLMLLVMSFYLAREKKWFLVGLLGFLISLTRSIGVFVCLPLFYEYAKQKSFKLKFFDKKVLFFLFFPLGVMIYYFFVFRLTGDLLGHLHLEQNYWGVQRTDPVRILLLGLVWGGAYRYFAIFTLIWISLLIAFHRKLRQSYLFLSLVLFVLPLSIGKVGLMSIMRYSVVVFSIPLLLGKITKNLFLDLALSVILIVHQVYFMMLWSLGLFII